MQRVAVIGFGFAGNALLANLVRQATEPLTVYVIAPSFEGRGLAYSTPYLEHLLNVRAGNMSALAEAPQHFVQWLGEYYPHFTPMDFVPRKIYGDYLAALWDETQHLAAEKQVAIKLVPSRAVAMQLQRESLAVITERGDAIAVDSAVLATGNEVKPFALLDRPILQDPWAPGALADAAKTDGPLMLIGTGLTAVDTVLALRAEGYRGLIVTRSRRGLWPRAHRDYGAVPALDATEIAAQHLLRDWAKFLRRQTRGASDWRAVIDGLRPFTQNAWQRLRTRQQQLFFRRVAPYWSVHRHRMAPQIAAQIEAEWVAGSLRPAHKGEAAALAINCTGSELDVARSGSPLLKNLLAQGLIERHANGIGIATDPQARAWGSAYPNLYAIGGLMTGQLLESTAVPELRAQAALVATAIAKQNQSLIKC